MAYVHLLDHVLSVAISSDTKYIISGSSDKSIKIFNLLTAEQLYQLTDAHNGTILIVFIHIQLIDAVSSVISVQ